MMGRLNHVAIAVPDLKSAMERYKVLGANISQPQALPEHGVTVVFIDVGNTKIELLEPLGEASPLMSFLQKNPEGGIHHVCLETDDVEAKRKDIEQKGLRVLGQGYKIGAHGLPVIFVHPKDMGGVLLEFEQTQAHT